MRVSFFTYLNFLISLGRLNLLINLSQNAKKAYLSTKNHFFVTKAEVISEISDKTGIPKEDVSVTVEAFFSIVKNSMAEGNNIYVRGFGSFINKKRKKKIARNISKNTAIVIDEHFVPSFKPSKVFVEKIKTSDRVKELQE
nr:HU family DNA-binding protein [Fulvivirga aurantia]